MRTEVRSIQRKQALPVSSMLAPSGHSDMTDGAKALFLLRKSETISSFWQAQKEETVSGNVLSFA